MKFGPNGNLLGSLNIWHIGLLLPFWDHFPRFFNIYINLTPVIRKIYWLWRCLHLGHLSETNHLVRCTTECTGPQSPKTGHKPFSTDSWFTLSLKLGSFLDSQNATMVWLIQFRGDCRKLFFKRLCIWDTQYYSNFSQ